MGPIARIMPDGKRLHLRHGPSDLIILAEGQRGFVLVYNEADDQWVIDPEQ